LEALALLVRTAAVVALWVLLVAPFWRVYVLKKIQNRKDEATPLILERMPYLTQRTKPLYKRIQTQYSGLKKWKELVLGLIVISLQYDTSNK